MRFRVLGPIEADDGGTRLPLGGPKPRLLLAALLMEADRVVPTERLVDILWGDAPPESSRALVHTYVSSLRRALNRPGADETIVTRPPGYLVRVGPGALDRTVFEELVVAARAAGQAGRYSEAAERFRTAEALWHGAAYGGIGDSIFAAEAARLDELRLAATEERIAAEMELGRDDDLAGELTALVGAHPTHERLRARLMVVLYRLGRQADALATFHHGRQALAEQLGLDPGPELGRVHEAILRADPELLGAARTIAPRASAEPATDESHFVAVEVPGPRAVSSLTRTIEVPAQLLAIPADFTGRVGETVELVEHLSRGAGSASRGAPAACVITGKGGAGKSTLALRVAHEVAGAFPDGQLYTELRGTSENPAQPVEVLGRFLRALGTDPATVPESLDERAELFRTMLASRRVLVVLDDAASEQQVRPLLPGGAGNAVVVTARRRQPGLAGAVHIELDVLEQDEAVRLLACVAGETRVAAEPDAAARLVALCGCLPLAVRIVGARLATRGHWTLETMANRLADERRRLDELAVADQQVRAGIELAYRGLDEDARAALRAVGWIGLPDFPSWVAASLLDVSIEDAENRIEQLVDAQLLDFARIDATDQARYRIHELVQVYSRERAADDDLPGERAAAVRRLLGSWCWLIAAITNAAPTSAIAIPPAAPEPCPLDPVIATLILAHPRAWLDAEQASLVTAVERAATLDLADVSVALATALCGSVFAVGNRFEAWGRTHTAALTAARRAADRGAEATLLTQLGQLRCEQDRYAESHEYLLEALSIFRELGDPRGEATVLAAIGATCREQGRLREAMHFLDQAHSYFRSTPHDPALGYTGRLIGSTRLEQGDFAQAQADLTEAIAAYRRTGCRRGEALTMRSLSLVHRALGELDEALQLSLDARSIFRLLPDDLLEAYAAQSVAKTLIRLGRGAEAQGMLDGAMSTCDRLGDQWGMAFILRTRGELHLAAGRLAEAEADLTDSIARWVALDVPLWRARSERDLATLRAAQGDLATAAALRSSAMETFRAYRAREYSELALTGVL